MSPLKMQWDKGKAYYFFTSMQFLFHFDSFDASTFYFATVNASVLFLPLLYTAVGAASPMKCCGK